jgi:hypothetical protein
MGAHLQPVAKAYNHINKFLVSEGEFSSLLYLIHNLNDAYHSRIAKGEITFEEAMRRIGESFEAYEGNKAPTNDEEARKLVWHTRFKALDVICGPRV